MGPQGRQGFPEGSRGDPRARPGLLRAGSRTRQADRCLELAAICTPDISFVERVRALGVQDELLEEGLTELAAVVSGCADLAGEGVSIVADLNP